MGPHGGLIRVLRQQSPPARAEAWVPGLMRQPFLQLYVHFVWATWDRLPLITPQAEARIYNCIAAKCHELKCDPIAIGGIEDHVHLLVRLAPTVAPATLIGG